MLALLPRIGARPGAAGTGERRRHQRWDVDAAVRLLRNIDGVNVRGVAVNVSSSGMLVRTPTPLEVGRRYDLYVQHRYDIRYASAEVVRQTEDGSYGLQFVTPLVRAAMGASILAAS